MTQSRSRSRGRSKRLEEKTETRVVTYRRISTNETNQPHSLEAQDRSLREYVERGSGLVLVGDYFDMQTGTRTDRPGLEDLLAAAERNEFDLVLFYRTDRLARSVHGFMEVLQQLEQHGVALRSVTEPFETMTPPGKLMAQMLASFAEFEHDVLMDRIFEGITAKAHKGEWLGGRAPYGYTNDREGHTLAVVAEEAAIVKRIYRRYLAGQGAKAIAEELNAAGVRRRGSQRWTGHFILGILASPTYAGFIERNDEYFPGLHEAIVSRAKFDQVMALRQTKVGSDQFAKMAAGNSEYFLSGVLRCGVCDGAVVGAAANSKNRHYRYYQCASLARRAEADRCDNQRVDADALEAMVIEQILGAYRDSDLFEAAAALAVQHTPDVLAALDEQIRSAESAVSRATTAIDRYYGAFEVGELDPSELRSRVKRLEETLDTQQAELARLREQRRHEDPGAARLIDLIAAAQHIEEVLSTPEAWQVKRRLVQALVETIVVSPGRHVQVTLRVPTENALGTGRVLPGSRVRRRTGSHAKAGHTRMSPSNGGAGTWAPSRAAGDEELEWTPFRMGSRVVEVLGIEPRSVGF